LNPFCFCKTEYFHFTTGIFDHSAISPFFGGKKKSEHCSDLCFWKIGNFDMQPSKVEKVGNALNTINQQRLHIRGKLFGKSRLAAAATRQKEKTHTIKRLIQESQ